MKTLEDAQHILEATPIYTNETSTKKMTDEVVHVIAADLMSDVLAHSHAKTLLLTGLATHQSIHTANVADLTGIIYVRNKVPAEDIIQRAQKQGIPLFSTKYHMFEACQKLAEAGFQGLSANE